ncbi:MAG: hypothetical protein A3C70_01705 [Candidatus Zambryskibacteria bacterium RIFCSPHIGHO2_02_FULL_43_14]|uniref:DoxX family protein n=1 Tax=Candidatus Zambryskibacteria bacterium RIFCSPHIGHO2_02_FULL_43_14 TaxID=1802748 RepID=A0A1G2TIR6_9BACT|nr:MAG: hypothetical protein A2829_01530 [Candidatus Zambryskibacteria bacterium RIFCSPHIGHO2_01_FULL_43_60]OHA96958.1 MAG: hypothetical protein A3C70_01705 [Candidatus Zambryskibacteria bacterium RIFCSPHIGHO2_02_FULL_43_14]OHB03980.1 MAG: hypothetical protein A3B03_00770 [Candidatus Zambryskibacteria bacterium RIFCSPLOWO2_01_FULL_42_41]
MSIKKITWLGLRLAMGFIFLWAFIDKLFGLGFATTSKNAWLNGGSPTSGFLTNATHGPLAEFFKELAGIPTVDWLFMLGLLGVGVTLLFNKFVTWGAMAGSVMLLLMYLAVLPPANNPLIDDHIVYIFVLVLLALRNQENR